MLRFSEILKNDNGYLLFEVILTLAILSVGLTLLLRCFAAPLRAVQVSEDHLTAALLLEQKMEELQNKSEVNAEAMDGSFPGHAGKFKWKAEILGHLGGEGDGGKAAKLILTVFWKDGDKERSIYVTSLTAQK